MTSGRFQGTKRFFNIALNNSKQDLLDYKKEKCMGGTLIPTDLMPLVNKAWESSFARVDKNFKAISERGWNPLNYSLLLNEEIRTTMTEEERELEQSSDDIYLPSLQPNPYKDCETSLADETVTELSSSTTSTTQQSSLKFSVGKSAFSPPKFVIIVAPIVLVKTCLKSAKIIRKRRQWS